MSEQQAGSRIRVEALTADGQDQAAVWAERLGLPLQDEQADFSLQVTDDGLQLQQLGDDAPGACGSILSKERWPIAGCSAVAPGR